MENARAVWAIAALPGSREEDSAWKATLNRHLDIAKLLTRWSKTVRGEVIDGRLNFSSLVDIAERADQAVVAYLDQRIRSEGMSDESNNLIGQLPEQETIKQARRISLIRNWRRLQNYEVWRFAKAVRSAPGEWWLSIERKRVDRFLDKLLQQILDDWDSGVSYLSEDKLDRIRYLEEGTGLMPLSGSSNPRRGLAVSDWLQRCAVFDQSIKNLRERVRTK